MRVVMICTHEMAHRPVTTLVGEGDSVDLRIDAGNDGKERGRGKEGE